MGAIDQFSKGLEMFGILDTIKLKSKLLKPVFTPTQSGTNNTQNVTNLGDNWRKVR